MSGYSDMANDIRHHQFLAKWAPTGSWEKVEVTEENLRWNIARARAAEKELEEIKAGLKAFKRVLA